MLGWFMREMGGWGGRQTDRQRLFVPEISRAKCVVGRVVPMSGSAKRALKPGNVTAMLRGAVDTP